jgi:cysteinyl-tRNA synthetase
VMRLAMLGTHYRQPTDWTIERLLQSRATLMEWARLLHGTPAAEELDGEFLDALSDDLNTPAALAVLHGLFASARTNANDRRKLKRAVNFLGVYKEEIDADFMVGQAVDATVVEALIVKRNAARKAKNFAEADRVRGELTAMHIAIEDGPTGTTWKVMS